MFPMDKAARRIQKPYKCIIGFGAAEVCLGVEPHPNSAGLRDRLCPCSGRRSASAELPRALHCELKPKTISMPEA